MITRLKKFIVPAVLFVLVVASVSWYLYEQNEYNKTLVYSVPRTFTKREVRDLENQLKEARQSLSSVSTDEKKFEWNRKVADVYFELGALKEAKQHYVQAIKIDPKSAPAREDLFDLAIEMKDYKLADKSMKKAIALNPTSSRWKNYIDFRKNVMFDSQEKILDLYVDALAGLDGDHDMHIAYARFLEESGDKESAILEWTRAGELNPQDIEKYNMEINRLHGVN